MMFLQKQITIYFNSYICILCKIKTVDINIMVVYLYVNTFCMETKRRAMLP